MPLQHVLSNWEDYDDYKAINGSNPRYFTYTDQWEVDYLIGKLKGDQNILTREEITKAIAFCGNLFRTPPPRRLFVQCVLLQLGLL